MTSPPPAPEVMGAATEARYAEYTGQASQVVRTSAVSLIALTWLFAGGLAAKDAAPQKLIEVIDHSPCLRTTLIGTICALAFDALQYTLSALGWGLLSWSVDRISIRDRANAPLTIANRLAWRAAKILRITRGMEQKLIAANVWRNVGWSDRRQDLRDQLTGATPDPALLLGPPPSAFAVRLAGLFFWAKVASMAMAFGATLTYVLA